MNLSTESEHKSSDSVCVKENYIKPETRISIVGSLLLPIPKTATCSFIQCQPHPIDMVIKVGVDGFSHIGHLVTRAVFLSASGKVEIFAINYPFTDFNYMFQYDSIYGKFNGTDKA